MASTVRRYRCGLRRCQSVTNRLRDRRLFDSARRFCEGTGHSAAVPGRQSGPFGAPCRPRPSALDRVCASRGRTPLSGASRPFDCAPTGVGAGSGHPDYVGMAGRLGGASGQVASAKTKWFWQLNPPGGDPVRRRADGQRRRGAPCRGSRSDSSGCRSSHSPTTGPTWVIGGALRHRRLQPAPGIVGIVDSAIAYRRGL